MKAKRILIKEDFDVEEVQKYIDQGFEVHVLSNRKIQKKDKKTHNRLKKVRLSEDNLRFGEIRELHKKYNYDVLLTGDNPSLEKFMANGKKYKKSQVVDSKEINSLEEALEFENKERELKFAKRAIVYRYELRSDAPALKGSSRDFCINLTQLSDQGFRWSKEDIDLLDNGMPSAVSDVFRYRGGYYNVPNNDRINKGCRHTWVAEFVILDDEI